MHVMSPVQQASLEYEKAYIQQIEILHYSRSVVLISLIVMCSLKLIVISPLPNIRLYFIMYFIKSHKFVRNRLIFQKDV